MARALQAIGPEPSDHQQYALGDLSGRRLDRVDVEQNLRLVATSLRSDLSVAHSGAETTLVVTPGQTTVVGGISRQSGGRSTSRLGGAVRAAGGSDQLLLLTVSVDDEGEGR